MSNSHSSTINRLRESIIRNGWQHPTLQPGWHSVMPVKDEFSTPQEQKECYLTESILTGLSTKNPHIALRCLVQASVYRAQLPNFGGSFLSDARQELQNRIEKMLCLSQNVLKPLIENGEV